MKKFLSLLLAVTMLFSSAFVATKMPIKGFTVKSGAYYYKIINHIEYRLSDDATHLIVAGPENDSIYGDINIWSSYAGYPVTEIGEYAFCDCTSITSVTLPETIETIGTSFWNCSSLVSINIPESVRFIDEQCFRGCTSLSSIHISKNMKSINSLCFKGCSSLTDIVIPGNIVSIESGAFHECTNLRTVEIQEGVKKIDSAFSGCINLKKFIVPNSVSYISDIAFGYPNPSGLVIYCQPGSYAESYARTEEITCRKYYPKPGKVSNVKLSSSSSGIKVTWGRVSGAKQYRVYRKTGSSSWKYLGKTTGTTFFDKNAYYGYKYYYTVRAENAGGLSDLSSTPSAVRLAIPDVTKASSVYNGVKVYWKSVSGASAYRIYRKYSGTNWSYVGKTTSTSFLDTKAPSGKTLYYTVRAENGSSLSSFENGVSVKYVKAPHMYKAALGSRGIEVTWGKVSGADMYKVYRRAPGNKWYYIGTTSSTKFIDVKGSKNIAWIYTARAVDGGALSAFENGVSYVPAPKMYKAARTDSNVTVTWKEVPNATNYRIYRRTASSNWKLLGNSSVNSYVDYSSNPNTTYYYTARAEGSFGLSGFENGVICLGTPYLTGAVEISANKAQITWDPVSGASAYNVYRMVNGSNWKYVGKTTDTKYYDTYNFGYSNVCYTVRAVSGSNLSDFITDYTLVKIPRGLEGYYYYGDVELSWSQVPGASNYRVYRRTDNSNWKYLGTTAYNSFTDSTIYYGGTYYYTIRAEQNSSLTGYDEVGTPVQVQ